MHRLILILALAACPPVPKADLVTRCSSSAECTHDTNGCTYCYNGQCSCTLPAEPAPANGSDAASSNEVEP